MIGFPEVYVQWCKVIHEWVLCNHQLAIMSMSEGRGYRSQKKCFLKAPDSMQPSSTIGQ